MSHRGVEIVLGRLATDEALRSRFVAAASRTLEEFLAQGRELSTLERDALETLDPVLLQRFADALHPRLQRAALRKEQGSR